MSGLLDGRAGAYVTCWTVQHQLVWRHLQETGHYRIAEKHIDKDFTAAYNWLCGQMRKRIAGAQGCYPIWAYARIPRESFRTVLRYTVPFHDPAEAEKMVLLTCRVPAREVLLSDYDTWHLVLNNAMLIMDEDPEAIDRWYDSLDERLTPEEVSRGMTVGGAYPPEVQREIEASWEHIFDIEYWIGLYPDTIVQATFETLRLEHVVRAVPLGRAGVSVNRRTANLIRYLSA